MTEWSHEGAASGETTATVTRTTRVVTVLGILVATLMPLLITSVTVTGQRAEIDRDRSSSFGNTRRV